MLPFGHLVFGYLLLSLARRVRGDIPDVSSLPWLVLGTQLPDLIDKPLAWGFGVLPSSRSLAHSLLVAVPLVVFANVWFRRRGRDVAGEALTVGYLSHLAADALLDLRGGIEWITFLAWPLLSPPQYPSRPAFWPPYLLVDPLEIVFGVAVVLLWIADGKPGLEYVQRARSVLARARS